MKLHLTDNALVEISRHGMKAGAIVKTDDGFAFNVDELRIVATKPTGTFSLCDVAIKLQYAFGGKVVFERDPIPLDFEDEISLRDISASVPFTVSSC